MIFREEPCKTALNRVKGMMFGWALNPYLGCSHRCTFCYVRAFEKRADRPSDDRYGTSIRVKPNVVEVLRSELRRRSWQREPVAIGAATDPYQPAEGTYRLTRGCLQALADAYTPFSLVTRGPMVVRDIDVLTEASHRVDISINFSLPTLDPEIWRRTEPGTAPPRQRLRALARLRAAGIRAGIGMAPLLPGISDRPELIADVVKAARDAGAAFLWANVLYLRPGTREHFLENLARDWPEQLDHYIQLYRHPYLDREQTAPILQRVSELKREYVLQDRPIIEPAPRPAVLPDTQLPLFAGAV